jgi:hypothetical protein
MEAGWYGAVPDDFGSAKTAFFCLTLLPLKVPSAREVSSARLSSPFSRQARACTLFGVCRAHRHGLGRDLFLRLAGDEVAVHGGGDGRIAGTFAHGRQLAAFKLLQCPLQRIGDDRRVQGDRDVLLALTIRSRTTARGWSGSTQHELSGRNPSSAYYPPSFYACIHAFCGDRPLTSPAEDFSNQVYPLGAVPFVFEETVIFTYTSDCQLC